MKILRKEDITIHSVVYSGIRPTEHAASRGVTFNLYIVFGNDASDQDQAGQREYDLKRDGMKASMDIHAMDMGSLEMDFTDRVPFRLIPPCAVDINLLLSQAVESMESNVEDIVSTLLASKARIHVRKRRDNVAFILRIGSFKTERVCALAYVSKFFEPLT